MPTKGPIIIKNVAPTLPKVADANNASLMLGFFKKKVMMIVNKNPTETITIASGMMMCVHNNDGTRLQAWQ